MSELARAAIFYMCREIVFLSILHRYNGLLFSVFRIFVCVPLQPLKYSSRRLGDNTEAVNDFFKK